MRTPNYKHKIWEEILCDWKLNLTDFIVFNALETWRQYKLMINLGIVKFFKKSIKRFLNYCEICTSGPNCKQKWQQKQLNAG